MGSRCAPLELCTELAGVRTVQESNSSPAILARRRYSAPFKRPLIQLAEQPGPSVAFIALKHGISANLVFKRRRQTRSQALCAHVPSIRDAAGVRGFPRIITNRTITPN